MTSQSDGERAENLNLNDLPEFRSYQSAMDKKLAELNEKFEQARQQADTTAIENKALAQMVQGFVAENPERREQFQREAEVAKLRAENEYYRQREEQTRAKRERDEKMRTFREFNERLARAAGLDINDPRFQKALDSGDYDTVERAKSELLRELYTSTASTPEVPAQHNPVQQMPPLGQGAHNAPNRTTEEQIQAAVQGIRSARGSARAMTNVAAQYPEAVYQEALKRAR